jgi:uncharacterized protein YndB with AHSA1/START domain
MGEIIPFPPRHWLTAYRQLWLHSLDRLDAYLDRLPKGDAMSDLILVAPKDEPIITGVEPRVLNAPIALVWKCFSEREHIARWWGPKSLGNLVIREFDFRVGGKWRFDHELKRGPVIPFNGVYRAIEPVTRIVNTFGVEGMFDGASVEETSLFEAQGETTLYRQIMRFEDFATRDGMVSAGMEKGARESMAQLDSLLAELKEMAP